MGTTTADQTTAFEPSAGAATKKDLPPVKLGSAHDFSLVTRALTNEQDSLKALAKKNREEGYEREARNIEADIAAIEKVILPQVRQQQELKLVTHEQLEKQVRGALGVLVHRAFDGLGDKKVVVNADGYARRRDRLVDALAARVVAYSLELANTAYNTGYQARTMNAEAIAAGVVNTLSVTSTVN